MNARAESFRSDSRVDSLRIPPQSVEAEQAVLGALMLSPESLAEVGDLLTEDDFYRRDHRLIYRAISELSSKQKPFDAVTLGDWFQANALTEQVGGSGYLIDLASTTPSAANVRAYAEIVRDRGLLRRLIEVGTEIVGEGFRPEGLEAELVLAEAQRKLAGLGLQRSTGGVAHVKDGMREWFADLQRRWESGEAMTGLETPWRDLNDQTLGLQDGDLYVAAGRPNMGKSMLGFNLALHAALHGLRTLVFSLEMTRKQFISRLTSSHGQIPHNWLRSPAKYPDEDYWSQVTMAIKEICASPLAVDDSANLTIDQIFARARRAHLKAPLRLVLVDHLHIVRIVGKDPVRERGEVSRMLKALAKELNCPVVALAQLNRANTSRPDKRPHLSDLRESGAIEQDADDIWFLHREDYYDRKSHLKGVVELHVAKARNAKAGDVIHLRNRFDQSRLDTWEGPLPEPAQPEPSTRRSGGFRQKSDRKSDAAGGDA